MVGKPFGNVVCWWYKLIFNQLDFVVGISKLSIISRNGVSYIIFNQLALEIQTWCSDGMR